MMLASAPCLLSAAEISLSEIWHLAPPPRSWQRCVSSGSNVSMPNDDSTIFRGLSSLSSLSVTVEGDACNGGSICSVNSVDISFQSSTGGTDGPGHSFGQSFSRASGASAASGMACKLLGLPYSTGARGETVPIACSGYAGSPKAMLGTQPRILEGLHNMIFVQGPEASDSSNSSTSSSGKTLTSYVCISFWGLVLGNGLRSASFFMYRKCRKGHQLCVWIPVLLFPLFGLGIWHPPRKIGQRNPTHAMIPLVLTPQPFFSGRIRTARTARTARTGRLGRFGGDDFQNVPWNTAAERPSAPFPHYQEVTNTASRWHMCCA